MKYMYNEFDIGDVYNDFVVLDVFDVSDYHSTAVHLRHIKTGLEVFHMINDDSENLFSFTFRTPNTQANGAAHIIEHSVLCGSEKFPLKDPFIKMSNQSVKTYLNAMTYPDHTVFPASSTSKTDYFNLMNVYGDAVFFPKLDPEIFMQEAHRLDIDDNGKVVLKGVVFNEMKGSYSSFESVMMDCAMTSVLKGSIYEKDSGGDPLVIPTLTHKDFVAFHDKWYRPENCFVFLYGNIPTKEQLDFLQTNFITRLEKKYPDINVSEENRKAKVDEFVKYITPQSITNCEPIYALGPASENNEKGNTVLMSWRTDPVKTAGENIENVILSGILMNHDGSPLTKALIESGLGDDTSPANGLENTFYTSVFTAGLRGVKKGDELKVKKVIIDTLKKLVKEGVSETDIKSTLAILEFSQREIKRAHGPYAIRIMNSPIAAWLTGNRIKNRFAFRSVLSDIKKKIETEKGYIESLIQTKFLDNKNSVLIVVTPSNDYNKDRDQKEKALIDELMKNTSVEQIKKQNEALHTYQQREEDDSCLPHLSPKDFLSSDNIVERINTNVDFIDGVNSGRLPFIYNEENTNGIVYLDIGFPADIFSPEEYKLLPLYAEIATDCGWRGKNWSDEIAEIALHTNGVNVMLLTSDSPNSDYTKSLEQKYNWIKRDWVIFKTSMLEEESSNAIDIVKNILTKVDFSDKKRIEDLIKEFKNDIDSYVIPSAHEYVLTRTKRLASRSKAVDELWNGLVTVYAVHEYAKARVEEIAKRLMEIHKKLISSGAFVHVTCEKSFVHKIKELSQIFVKDCSIGAICDKAPYTDQDFYNATELKMGMGNCFDEVLIAQSQVGFAAETAKASDYTVDDCMIEDVCASYLNNTKLWEQIRTIGGAYGSFFYCDPWTGLCSFATYRDPTPEKSCDTFEKVIEDCKNLELDKQTVDGTIIGAYSSYIQPKAPAGKGANGLFRLLYGVSEDEREKKVRRLLNVTPEDMKKGFENFASYVKGRKSRAILTEDKGINYSGKKIILPL